MTIEGFLDRYNLDVSRVAKCCIQQALPDGRIVPFCAYNTLYRFATDHRPIPPDATDADSTPTGPRSIPVKSA